VSWSSGACGLALAVMTAVLTAARGRQGKGAALSGEESRVLAEEQAALRRIATLVARGVPPDQVFAAVTKEVGELLPVDSAAMGRLEPDGMFTTVAAWSKGLVAFPVGRRWVPEGKNDRLSGPYRRLCRCLRPGRCRRPRGRLSVSGRDANHRPGPPLGRHDRRLLR
jgi:hypothetical protein